MHPFATNSYWRIVAIYFRCRCDQELPNPSAIGDKEMRSYEGAAVCVVGCSPFQKRQAKVNTTVQESMDDL